MNCSRNGCEEIMCHTYIYTLDIGYVCPECQREFKEMMQKEGSYDNLTEGEIARRLKEFMDTYKGSHSEGGRMDIDDFFEQYTR